MIIKKVSRLDIATGKKTNGNGLGGLVKYISREGEATLVATNMTYTRSVRDVVAEFGLRRLLRPQERQGARHFELSFDECDPLPAPGELKLMVHRVMKGLGFEDCPYIAYLHLDGHTPHIHVATTPILPNGKLVREGNDYYRCMALGRLEELRYNLTLCPTLKYDDPRHQKRGLYGLGLNRDGSPKIPPAGRVKLSHLSDRDRELVPKHRIIQDIQSSTPSLRVGELGVRDFIRAVVGPILPKAGKLHLSWGDFTAHLLRYGIDASYTEKLQLRLRVGGKRPMFVSSINEDWTLRKLIARGMTMDAPRQMQDAPRVSIVAARNLVNSLQVPGPALPAPGRLGLVLGPSPEQLLLQAQKHRLELSALIRASSRRQHVPPASETPRSRLPGIDDILPRWTSAHQLTTPGLPRLRAGSYDDGLPPPGIRDPRLDPVRQLHPKLGPQLPPPGSHRPPSPGKHRRGSGR